MTTSDIASGREAVGDAAGLMHMTEHIHDGVVAFEFIEDEPIVRYVNAAFVDIFGYDRQELFGRSLNQYIVPEWLEEEATSLDGRTQTGEVNYQRVRRQTADGLKEFLYRGIPYQQGEGIDGYAIYTDLTDVAQKERQLQVLNRILRHNLRTEVTILSGNIERLLAYDGDSSDEKSHVRSALEESTETLHRLTDEATHINRILFRPQTATSELDAAPVVETTADQFNEQYPEADIETECPPSLAILATEDLHLALESLLENAIEHNPSEEPRVLVSVSPVEGSQWVDIDVHDDGPLIPETERTVISGGSEITPHQHGSGLGLWLVKWTVERFGGTLSFQDSPLGGNCVRIRLRRHTE